MMTPVWFWIKVIWRSTEGKIRKWF